MTNDKYLGITHTATKYTRCNYIAISNALKGIPQIECAEEEVTKIDNGESVQAQLGSIIEQLTANNIGTTFPLVNPETMEPLGKTATYMDVNIIMRSLYYFLAARRDAQG